MDLQPTAEDMAFEAEVEEFAVPMSRPCAGIAF
jgi:hypothetical protein